MNKKKLKKKIADMELSLSLCRAKNKIVFRQLSESLNTLREERNAHKATEKQLASALQTLGALYERIDINE